MVDQLHREGHLRVGIPYLAGSRYCTHSGLLHVISREPGENGMPITLPDLGLYLTASDTRSPLAADVREYLDTSIPYESTTLS